MRNKPAKRRYCPVEGADPPGRLKQTKRTDGETPQMVRPEPYRRSMTPGKSPAVKG